MNLSSGPARVLSLLRGRVFGVFQRWSAGSREELRRSWYLHIDSQVSQLPGLPRSTMKVYNYFADVASSDGFCDPSAKDVANECLMSPSSVTRAIKELERLRLLVSVLRPGKPGRASRAYYVAKPHKPR